MKVKLLKTLRRKYYVINDNGDYYVHSDGITYRNYFTKEIAIKIVRSDILNEVAILRKR